MNSRNAWPDQRKRPDSSGRCWNGRAADGAGLDEGELMAPFPGAARSAGRCAGGRREAGRGDGGAPGGRGRGGRAGGQQGRAAWPRGGAGGPGLPVPEGPMARLDPLARHDFMATVITAMAEDGVSVVLSSHVLAELERVADYLILVSRGRVQGAGEVDDLLARYRVLTGPPAEADSLAARP